MRKYRTAKDLTELINRHAASGAQEPESIAQEPESVGQEVVTAGSTITALSVAAKYNALYAKYLAQTIERFSPDHAPRARSR